MRQQNHQLHFMHRHLPRISSIGAPFVVSLQFFPFRHIYAKLSHSFSSNNSSKYSPSNLSHLLQGHIPRRHLLQIHARVFRLNSHQNNLIATRLIGHYPSNVALLVLHFLHKPNIFPFNAIIRVLAEEGLFLKAFLIFKELKLQSILPNDLTFSFLLKACSRDGIDCVRQIHSHVVQLGFMYDSFVCNGLLMVYAKGVKDLVSSRKVFDEIPEKYMVCCWTSLISGYARVGSAEEAIKLFLIMLKKNLRPDSDTMVSVLSACSSLSTLLVEKWVILLAQFVKEFSCCGLSQDYVNIILIYLYGKCRKIEKCRESFNEISDNGKRSILYWNVMIGAYIQNGYALEALRVFRSMMENHDCHPNHVTMVSVVSACAEIGDLDLGMWVHEYMRTIGQKNVLSSNVNLATALIDMYSKCGSSDWARKVFDQMIEKDIVAFNAMIMGLAVNGEGEEALRVFCKMQETSLSPDSGTFLAVLCACSHSGLLDKGREVFKEMTRYNSVTPRLEHYACYIDLLARSGFVEEALDVATSMPFEPNNFVWGALLGGCVLHNRLELAQSISTMLVMVDPENSAGYVMLSNSFAADHRWGNISKLRSFMREKGVTKQSGRSWINVRGVVHEFLAGSSSYPQIGSIHQTMESLMREMRLSGS